jgi:hypothetical protein
VKVLVEEREFWHVATKTANVIVKNILQFEKVCFEPSSF